MTVEDVFDDMDVLDNELDTTDGGTDEERGLHAVKMAVRYCYTVASAMQNVLRTANKIVTTPREETTLKPPELLRVDALWALDTTTKLPKWKLHFIQEPGGHMPTLPWPLNWAVTPTNGQPYAYNEDAGAWYWLPVPDLAYDTRVLGLWLPEPPEDRKSDLNLPGMAVTALQAPIAAFATKYLTISLDDPIDELQSVAQEMFAPALKGPKQRDRSRAQSRVYAHSHST